MKKFIMSLIIGLMVLASQLEAKEVTICTSSMVGITAEMTCNGGVSGEKWTFIKLYKKGWRYAGDISGVSYSFMLIFEK